MKKKLLTTIIATCIAIITAFTFSACGTQAIDSSEFMSGIKEVGVTYYKSHDSYDNFADITATFVVNYESEEEDAISYYKNEGDTQLTEEVFTDTYKENMQITFSAKKIDGTLFVAVKENADVEETYYYVDENGKVVKETTNSTKAVIYEFGRENGAVTDKGYFMRKYTSEIEGGNPAVETKSYFKYADENAYRTAVNSLISAFNNDVINNGILMSGNSGILVLLSSMMNFSKDGNAFVMNMNMSSVNFDDDGNYEYTDGNADYRIVAGGDLIVTIDGGFESLYEGEMIIDNSKQEVKVVNSSSLTAIQTPYDGYEENSLLFLDTEPTNLIKQMQANLSFDI